MPFVVPTFVTSTALGARCFVDFALAQAVRYWTQVRGKLEPIDLPIGMTSDLASIPEVCWSIPGFQPNGPIAPGAWVHDGLYRGTAITTGEPWTRADADLVLLEWMQNAGMPLVVQEAIYRAVRDFGQPAWDAGHAGGAA
jgi:hypothetical protein